MGKRVNELPHDVTSSKQRRQNMLNFSSINPLTNLNDVKVDDVIRLFLQDCSIRNLSIKTIEWYRDKLLVFVREFETGDSAIHSPSDISSGHIKNFIVGYRNSGRSDATINGMLRAVRAFLNYCYEEGFIREDIGRQIKLIKEKQKVVETFSKEQSKKLLNQPDLKTFIGLRDLTIMMLLLESGIRISELCGINTYDINWRDGLILVDGKGNKQRHVPIQLTTLKQLEKYYKVRGELETTAFFITLSDTPLTVRQAQDRIKEYGRQAKIDRVRVSPHTFRHTFAKMYIKNGGDIFTLQKILGHTSLEMVRRYVNMFSGEVAAAHKKFSPIEGLFS